MTIVVHDSRPYCTDNLTAEISHEAIIAFAVTEIISVNAQFRFLDNITRRRFNALRDKDRLMQKVL